MDNTHNRNTVVVFFRDAVYNSDIWFSRDYATVEQAKRSMKQGNYKIYKIVRLN